MSAAELTRPLFDTMAAIVAAVGTNWQADVAKDWTSEIRTARLRPAPGSPGVWHPVRIRAKEVAIANFLMGFSLLGGRRGLGFRRIRLELGRDLSGISGLRLLFEVQNYRLGSGLGFSG